MLTSTLRMPPAAAWPGFNVVTNDSVAPCASTLLTRSPKPIRAMAVTTRAAGHRMIGASTYQTPNATGNHARTTTTNRTSGRSLTAQRISGRGLARRERPRRGRRYTIVAVAGNAPDPDQPHDQHVEHDQALPDVEMRPFEGLEIPLAKVEEADHADDVEQLHGQHPDDEADDLVPPGRGKRKHGGQQDQRSLAAIASGLDRPCEAIRRAADDLAAGHDVGIEHRDDRRRNRRERVGPRHHEPLLRPRRQFQAEQHRQHDDEQDKEADHGAILSEGDELPMAIAGPRRPLARGQVAIVKRLDAQYTRAARRSITGLEIAHGRIARAPFFDRKPREFAAKQTKTFVGEKAPDV